MKSVNAWVRDHDDRWSFILLYVGGAIGLSVFFNLFSVVMLMGGNYGLKVYRNHLVGADRPFLYALWQVKLDIALVLFALLVVVYVEHVVAALGLGQAARAGQAVRGLQMATRFGIIERGLRVFLLTVDDFARLLGAFGKALGRKKAFKIPEPVDTLEEERSLPRPPWKLLGKGDIVTLGFGGICLFLLLLSPVFVGAPPEEILTNLLRQLHPLA